MYTVSRLKAIATVLSERYTNKNTSMLVVWPRWLHWSHIDLLEKNGLVRHEHYKSAFSHTSYFLTTERGNVLVLYIAGIALVGAFIAWASGNLAYIIQTALTALGL